MWEFAGYNKSKQQLDESALLVFWKKKKADTDSTKIIILCSLCFPATFQTDQIVEAGKLSRNNVIKT